MGRLRLLLFLYLTILLIITIRLMYVQLFSGDDYAPNNYLQTERIEPLRGNIYDRNHEPIVINRSSYLLYAEPDNINDEHNLIKKIDSVLDIGVSTLEGKLDMSKKWVALSSELTEEQKKDIEALKIKGLGFEKSSQRYYPESSISAHLVGFVGKDADGDNHGYFGVEGYYNKDLEGLPGIFKTERDVFGKPIFVGTQDRLKGENGRDLVLTIDKRTQSYVKKKLHEGIEKYKAKSGCITVADPSTMEILALACLPDFDPSHYGMFSEAYFRNPVISNVFEPGSIFKPLIVAAALEEAAIEDDDIINESGPLPYGAYTIRTWNDEYNGKISITKVLQTSSNVGMVRIGQKMERESLIRYLNDFGFGERTGIDLQGEAAQPIKPIRNWYDIDFATVTFGQGIAVTQIQMLTAFSSIINGGELLKPHIVKELVSESGKHEVLEPVKIRQVVSEETSNSVKKMLQAVVEGGEANWDVPDGYKFGGKTGTAQIAIEGTYDPSKTNASFIGFAPVDKPEFVVLVVLNQPEVSPWASETAAPLFFEVASDLLVQYNIAPE